MTWKTVRLSDVADLCLGKMLDERKNKGDLLPYLRNINVRWGHFNLDNLKEMRFEPREAGRYGLRAGDIVLCEGGEPGRCALWTGGVASMMIQKALHRIRPREDVDGKFLYYNLFHLGRSGGLEPLFTGATIKHLPGEQLVKVQLRLPPLDHQHRIAAILGAYDDLIEVNRQRIALLENMARGLFEEWFVRFRFPGYNEAIVQGAVPEGWKLAPIKSAYSGLYDGPHATPAPAIQGPVFLGIGNLTESGRLDLTSVRNIAEEDFGNWTKRVTPQEGDVVFTYEATLNRYAIIPKGFRGCLGRRLALIRANSKLGLNRFLYLYFFTDAWRAVIAKNKLSGATVDRVPLSKFPDFPVLLPPNDLIGRLDVLIRPIFEQLQALDESNGKLAASRDFLLPRLISGQLTVATAEREMMEAA